jgi:hypothetical protein
VLAAIITQLKTGRIKSVIPDGSRDTPATPYIVVKMDRSMIEKCENVRVIVHMEPDQEQDLRDFVINDLSVLLSEWGGYSHNGAYNQLDKGIDDIPILISDNDDGTIAMERVFLLPSILF